MIECIVTSSILIVVVIVLRFLFRGKISRRLQYALWGLVLLRLLMPFPLIGSQFSIMNWTEVGESSVITYIVTDSSKLPDLAPAEIGPDATEADHGAARMEYEREMTKAKAAVGTPLTVSGAFSVIWLLGSIAAGLWVLYTNISFYKQLHKDRKVYDATDCALPVYVTEQVTSPCLFGFLRPTIYLTPKAVIDEDSTRYVLAHELCHYRHADHIWSILRGVCLAVYWWNPLVWAAAILSRTDSELACDEAVIRQIGEENRISYGRTLVNLIAIRKASSGLMHVATTMASGKRDIKTRLNMIIKNPQTVIPALATVLVIIVLCVGCTFTGAESTPWELTNKISEDNISYVSAWATHTVRDFNKDETARLVQLLNRLKRSNFTENTELAGITPEYGLRIYYNDSVIKINHAESPYGSLEMTIGDGNDQRFSDTQWWIDNAALSDYIKSLTVASLAFPETTKVFSSDHSDLIQIGRDAATFYYSQFMGNHIPRYWRITKHEPLSGGLMAGDEKEFTVWLTSYIETDGGGFLIGEGIPYDPKDINKGGICPEVGRQIHIKALGGGEYEIVSMGTGGGTQGLSPVDNSVEESFVSYELAWLKNGELMEAASQMSGNNARLVEEVIMNHLIKSTVRPSIDIKTLEECIMLRASYSDGTKTDYYVYLLDGKAGMQGSMDGVYTFYTYIGHGLYDKLVQLK